METITKARIEQNLKILRGLQPWADYSIDWWCGQPQLVSKGGGRDISPRGSKREVNSYIEAMITALHAHERHENVLRIRRRQEGDDV